LNPSCSLLIISEKKETVEKIKLTMSENKETVEKNKIKINKYTS
jgi:hypothetical protein